ncbi:MAG: PKD domain-containing protein [Planctomycetes bacterium]|nr:PKD domain-containing protein [Planctomycetota bacterium]
MASDQVAVSDVPEKLFTNPWPALATGVGITLTGLIVLAVLPDSWFALGAVLLFLGLLAGGVGVVIRPWSAAVLGTAAFIALLASVAIAEPGSGKVAEIAQVLVPEPTTQAGNHYLWPVKGEPFTEVVASFLRPSIERPPEDYSATIDWGDGQTTLGKVVLNNAGGYDVSGTYTYEKMGLYPVNVTVSDREGKVATVTSVARVAIWDSARTLLRVLAAVAAACAGLVLLPSLGRRVAVSLIILFHFGGILTAVTNVQPAPWLSTQLWTVVYRPYLQFLYCNNAYHFYSPDPGPATLLWFRIEFETTGGQRHWRWVKVPELATDRSGDLADLERRLDDKERAFSQLPEGKGPADERARRQQELVDLRSQIQHLKEASQNQPAGAAVRPDGRLLRPLVEYTRRLSIAESINSPNPLPANFQALLAVRLNAPGRIPLHPDLLPTLQYHEPPDLSKEWLRSYVRFVARAYPFEHNPDLKVTGIKVYRVTHEILPPNELAEGTNPNDPTLFEPFYMGEYDAEGNLKPSCFRLILNSDGTIKDMHRDPYLYWLIPIIRVPKEGAPTAAGPNPPSAADKHRENPEEYELKDYVKIQAGDEEEGGQP